MSDKKFPSAEEQNRRAIEAYERLGGEVPKFGPARDWGDLRKTLPGEALLDDRPPCGTTAGYSRHKRVGESCPQCLEAHAEAGRRRKEKYRNRQQEALLVSND